MSPRLHPNRNPHLHLPLGLPRLNISTASLPLHHPPLCRGAMDFAERGAVMVWMRARVRVVMTDAIARAWMGVIFRVWMHVGIAIAAV